MCKKIFNYYKNRKLLVENLKYVSKVVPQKTEDYSYNLNKIKPNFFVHGDDWKYDNRKKTRAKVIKTLKKWSGKLIEPKYTKNMSTFHANAGGPPMHLTWHMAENIYLFFFDIVTD